MKIVVIGAGVAGLSIGWRLAQAGAETVVLERAQPRQGATWASAGMIAAIAQSGDNCEPQALLGRRSRAMWPGFAAEIEESSGRSIGYRVDGKLEIARTAEEYDALSRRGLAMLSSAEACAMEPMLRGDIAGALWNPDEAQVDNRALGPALAMALIGAGGMLRVNEAAIRIEHGKRDAHAIGVVTPFGTHWADAVVLAAGAWSALIEGVPDIAVPPVVPVKGEMIALCPPMLPKHLIECDDFYIVPRGERVLVGATVTREGFDTSLSDAAEDWLFTHAAALLPGLAALPIDDHWSGLRPGSPDDLPIIGKTVFDRLFVATGQFRSGILYAPAIARAVCDAVLGRESTIDLAAFDPARFHAAFTQIS